MSLRTLCLALLPLCLFAQPQFANPAPATIDLAKLNSEAGTAFRAWRESDPKLETELAAPAIAERLQKAAGEAGKACFARQAVADAACRIAKDAWEWLDKESTDAAIGRRADALTQHETQISVNTALLDRTREVFATDKDPGIQKLNAAMDKERVALIAIREALAAEQKVLETIQAAGARTASRAIAASHAVDLMTTAKRNLELLEKEGALWHSYYQALAQAPPK